MTIFDFFTFPVSDLRAQELARILASLYPTQKEVRPLITSVGVKPRNLTPALSPNNMWLELLAHLSAEGKLRDVVEKAAEQFPNSPRSGFLKDLIAEKVAPISAEPLEPDFPFDHTVTEPEALLFFDDLTIPTGRVSGLITTLQSLLAVVPSVCLLRVENQHGSFYGTGFRISKGLVLTNEHVLFPRRAKATRVIVDFGFEILADGTSGPVTSLRGDLASINGERPDDWAVISVPDMKESWPNLSLDNLPSPRVGDPAYILQHPGGQHKRLGFVRNTISYVDDRLVRYLTDTQPGSSGAPVFDSAARLIALHHAGGQPVEIAGRPPVAKNEGIRITKVIERIVAKKILG